MELLKKNSLILWQRNHLIWLLKKKRYGNKELLKGLTDLDNRNHKILDQAAEAKRQQEESKQKEEQLTQKWVNFQDQFNNSLQSLYTNIESSIKGMANEQTLDTNEEKKIYSPESVTAKQAQKLLKDKKNIVILTGPGVSVASQIPTFKENKELWMKDLKYCNTVGEILTSRYFK